MTKNELPYIEPRFKTFNYLGINGVVANNYKDIENWYFNNCIQWQYSLNLNNKLDFLITSLSPSVTWPMIEKIFIDECIETEYFDDIIHSFIDNEYYKDYVCSFFSETIGKPMNRTTENNNWCGAGQMLAIDAAGKFYPCTRFAQYALREKKECVIGDVDSGIDYNKLRPFLSLDRCTQSTEECIDCEVAGGCAWCQGENYDAAKTDTVYQRATAICKMHKARVRANNYYWNKLYRKLELEGQSKDELPTSNHININC